MGQKLIVGPINKGLRSDRTAFVIDNDSFPMLVNAYQWRGRVKRKRGTQLLGRLTRYFDSTSTAYSSISTIALAAVTGAGNLLTGFSLQTNGNIIPGSVTITVGGNNYTDPGMNGTLSPSGTINYATGAIAIAAEAGNNASAVFRYYPDLPVMGLEDFFRSTNAFPGTIAFDTRYAYNILTTEPYSIYSVSFYKNPPTAGSYTQKTTWSPVVWNGEDYQQFWTTNYQGAMWTTNGIEVPFDPTNVGMQFKPITTVSGIVTGPPSTADLFIAGHGLTVGDFIFVNEVQTTTGINFQTGYVTNVIDINNVTVTFPNATIATNGTGGIAQYLTRSADPTKDCIRWYDGDPTDGNPITPGFNPGRGWVNFMPPLSQFSYIISDLPADQYYLVGARMIQQFKDRLLFFGPVVQTSTGTPIYLQDTIIYSQNGTPYYTVSFTGDPVLSDTVFFPILLPQNQTGSAAAFFADQTGFGGFIQAGYDTPLTTVSTNEDVLICGFDDNIQSRLVYSGNDIVPFNFFIINSELGSTSTFSTINLDQGVITRGARGYIITSQTQALRMDMEVPDQVFEVSLLEHGTERITAQRDFINEWVYFTYTTNKSDRNIYKFPNQTLFYNYRDNSWAIFNESYTTYGQFHRQTGFTWATIGNTYSSWNAWSEPWEAGESTLLQPEVIGGNQQGFVLIKGEGLSEGESLYIQSFASSVITCPDHGLNQGDYIYITDCIGTISAQVNNKIFSVGSNVTQNTFTLNPTITTGTYAGGGLITRLYNPFIQTKQFPISWEMARKTRIGPQQYLFTKTDDSQITLYIYLSQNASSAYNYGPIVPALSPDNSSLIYSTILYTCPESTNLGLTPFNSNLQTPTASQQNEIWHRMNTSLIGDTVQIGFTMSDSQMRELTEDGALTNQIAEIELHSFIMDLSPSQLLV